MAAVNEATEEAYNEYIKLLRNTNELRRVKDRASYLPAIFISAATVGLTTFAWPFAVPCSILTAYLVYDARKAREEFPRIEPALNSLEKQLECYQQRLDRR